MRLVAFALLSLAVSFESALSQQAPPGRITSDDAAPSNQSAESCVEVDIGGSKALDCINRKLKKSTERVSPVPNLPLIDAHSQDIHLGIVNAPAVRQQYGPNFGKSVVPFRPSGTYAPPALGGR